ncbi:lectin-like domain-containing protein [Lactiplantibacillus plantarum]|uniref:lectin-like domain-containing protein n=1 Tax=Lactiplantibacillus plantarum TaxID=1590 RepID=UPI003BA1817F
MKEVRFWGLLLGLFVCLGAVIPLVSKADVLDMAPAGLNLEGLFEPGKFDRNSATMQTVSKNGHSQHVIELTNDDNQVGAMWSTPVNRFNMRVDNQVSMWVNFGDKAVSEGLAVVLQNDPRKISAISRYGKKSIIGENLGVYGTDTYTRRTAPATIAKTAIQKSWALELDTKVNDGGFWGLYPRGNSFDEKPKKMHMAASYPASPDTYTQRGGLTSSYRFEQNHGSIADKLPLADGNWHHLVLKWVASKQIMSYTLDQGPTRMTTIDTTVFGKDIRNVTWGLTSTATTANARTLVVFDRLPQPIEIESDLNVTNLTQERTVHEGDWVHGGDELEYEYVLSYLNGDNEWQQVKASLPLPEQVHFSHAKIRYADGTEEEINLPADDNESSVARLQHDLQRTLSMKNPHAYITLIGEAAKVDRDTFVDDDMSYFEGHEMKTATATPHFTITTNKTVNLTIEPLTQVKKGEPVIIKGQIKLNDGLDFDNDGMRIEYRVNGEAGEDYQLSMDDPVGYVEFEVDAEELQIGENQITLRAHSKDNAYSGPVTVTVTVIGGELQLKKVSTESVFAPIKLTGTAQVSRPEGLEVVVNDDTGSKAAWRLEATATPLVTNQGRTLAGNLYYQDGAKLTMLGKDAVEIARQKTAPGIDYDVTAHWSSQQGLVLKTTPAAVPGSYQGTITWHLSTVPEE